MFATQEGSAPPREETRRLEPWWRLTEIWGTLAITAIWVAVIFVGVYGGDMTFANPGSGTTVIPTGAVVAICAAIATASVSKRAFHR